MKLQEDPLILVEETHIPQDHMVIPTKRRIVELLESFKRPLVAKEIYEKLCLKRATFHWIKNKMITDGVLTQSGKGSNTTYILTSWIGGKKTPPKTTV